MRSHGIAALGVLVACAGSTSTKPEPAKPAMIASTGGDAGDTDGDGATDDACPDEPEDRDGFEDGDGCPEPDNDADGVLDPYDVCPTVAGPGEGCPGSAAKPAPT